MQVAELKKVEKELGTFVEEFAPELGRAERRYWCKLYLTGLLLDGERKSIEPIAQRVPGGNEQALQQFVNQSPWAHEPVQEKLVRRAYGGWSWMIRRCLRKRMRRWEWRGSIVGHWAK